MPGAQKFGSIDLGSNSVRCLVVSWKEGVLEYISSGIWISRLTEGIGEGDYLIADGPLERTLSAVDKACALLERSGVQGKNTAFCATESLRGAGNGQETVSRIVSSAGFPLRILSGTEEAELSFKGAILGVPGADSVFDLGGGSLEIVKEGMAYSFPLGAVRMASRFGEDDGKVFSEIRGILGERFHSGRCSLAGVGGTSSSAVMMLKGIAVADYHPSKVHGQPVRAGELGSLVARLKMTPPGDRSSITGLEPGRADIIVAGLAAERAVLDAFQVGQYMHSETDLLWALCAETAAGRGLVSTAARIKTGSGR